MAIREPAKTKSSFGHALDIRKAMGEVSTIAAEWCEAFDRGDHAALKHLGEIMCDTLESLGAANAACVAATARERE